ncbi:alpha/beta fold hydrolase [Stutzerimonas stutzeri]|uniref:Putative hydrolase or acyltransferase of alpha/beta superfamily n=1 Tax=Stutzerimonas stutzeri RCH2 TaxID=644801 RepID=L0GIT5_STUST|nr:alpha/beta hydrolase [Stutzerimonas stutzeri]AGA86648.1 putative hydrolase or acyltransferase of alpha/beta superfamily [Stutzerimonas stutzeri RCH2]
MTATADHFQLDLNGISLSLYCFGPEEGRPVWLLHGFPECWHSWRNQIDPLVAAGYRVFVPEMRGYGNSSAPAEVTAYDVLTLCGDIRAAMDHFGHGQVAVVGHDWGAMVSWYLALLEPERVAALVTMSVPFAGRPRRPAIEIMRETSAGRFNYILYFQEPGRAERELDVDVDRTLRLLMYYQGRNLLLQDKPADGTLFEDDMQAGPLPQWCTEEDLSIYRRTFAGHGFRGALNWYRNFERNWQLTEPLQGQKIVQPTMFLIGNHDPVAELEAYTLKKMPDWVPDLEQRVLAPCGHWIQNEQAGRVNELLLGFLARRYPG